jgi:hypothetical protein
LRTFALPPYASIQPFHGPNAAVRNCDAGREDNDRPRWYSDEKTKVDSAATLNNRAGSYSIGR